MNESERNVLMVVLISLNGSGCPQKKKKKNYQRLCACVQTHTIMHKFDLFLILFYYLVIFGWLELL